MTIVRLLAVASLALTALFEGCLVLTLNLRLT